MTDPPPVQLAPEIEALALKTLAKRVEARLTVVRALIGQRYPDGHSERFRTPDGSRLGQVLRTDPEPQWVVSDERALHTELRQYPGNVVTVWEITNVDAAVDILHTYAPELLTEVTRVHPDAVKAALAQSEATGMAAAAGIARVKPSGVLTVKPDAKAGEAIERLVEAGLLTWDMRPALPAGDEPDPAIPAAMIAVTVAYIHRQGGRPDGTWGCLGCDWQQDKPHIEHVADMVREAGGEDVPPRVQAAEERREMRDLIDRSPLGEHVREVGPDGFARCRCDRWRVGSWEDHVADAAARDMERSR